MVTAGDLEREERASGINLTIRNCRFFFFLIFIYLFIYLFIYGCVGSSFLCEGSPQSWQAGATPHRGARASHHRGPSRCGAQAPDAQAQQLWLTGPVAPRHAGSSQTRARTRVPCIGRRTLNHCATREAPKLSIFNHVRPSRKRQVHMFQPSIFPQCQGSQTQVALGITLSRRGPLELLIRVASRGRSIRCAGDQPAQGQLVIWLIICHLIIRGVIWGQSPGGSQQQGCREIW